MPEHQQTTAHARYEHLKRGREPYLRRARTCASVTLPYLFPPEGATGETDLPTPFQGLGARGVNNLASKLLLALFPPNTPFFKMDVDDFQLDQLEGEGSENLRTEMNKALASVTRAVVARFDGTQSRNRVFDLLKNLIVGGSVLLEVMKDEKIRVHPLPFFVVKRDGEGNPVDIVLKEILSRRTAPQEVLDLAPAPTTDNPEDESTEDEIELYTWVRRGEGRWDVHQEIGDDATVLPDSVGTYPLDKCPWIPLRFISVEGEDYGRSYCEEYLGDLISLEKGTRSIVEFSAVAARILFFADPGGTTDPDDIAEASTGDVLDGDANDITTLALEKFPDFQITDAVVKRMENRLEQAFLLFSGIQRDAERVTAEEIRLLANELDEQLGGVYSLLAGEFQDPLVRRLIHQMKVRKDIPDIPVDEDIVNLQIVTGVAAIGRNHDLVILDTFIRGFVDVAQDAAFDYINFGDYAQRRAAAINLPVDGLIRSEEEVQQIQQQRQAAAAMEKAAPNAVNYLSERASEGAAQTQE